MVALSYAAGVAEDRTSGSLLSVGYEGRDADELVRHLRELEVSVVIDVRLNAISRKRGLSKTALRDLLHTAGIQYVHLRALGNPRDNRDAYRTGSSAARRRFRQLISSAEGTAAIDQIAEFASDRIVAVLCYESDHDVCHRACVINAVQQREPKVPAIRA